MPPAIGYCDETSPKVRTTRNCPATTIGIVQMKAGPAVARPKAKSVYTPTTGERYVNPSEKLLHSPSARVSCCRYPNEASCAASARICSASIRPPSGVPRDAGRCVRRYNAHKSSTRWIIAACAEGVFVALPSCWPWPAPPRSEEHTSELQSPCNFVCRLLLEK